LVLKEEAQVVPAYIMKLSSSNLKALNKLWQRPIVQTPDIDQQGNDLDPGIDLLPADPQFDTVKGTAI
jgi:hypothetical protein